MMISNEFPNKGVPSNGKGGWVDPPWDKVLNSTEFFKAFPTHILTAYERGISVCFLKH